MVSFSELLNTASASRLNMVPGTVLLGEMEGVDHLKFFVVAGVSNNDLGFVSTERRYEAPMCCTPGASK